MEIPFGQSWSCSLLLNFTRHRTILLRSSRWMQQGQHVAQRAEKLPAHFSRILFLLHLGYKVNLPLRFFFHILTDTEQRKVEDDSDKWRSHPSEKWGDKLGKKYHPRSPSSVRLKIEDSGAGINISPINPDDRPFTNVCKLPNLKHLCLCSESIMNYDIDVPTTNDSMLLGE